MKAELVAITAGAGVHAGKTPEEIMLWIARVSSPHQDSTNTGLIKYCWDHKHVSVFEQADMTVEIETSRAVSAQIIRHKSMDVQELSQRYAAVQEIEPYTLRSQDTKNRQNSIDNIAPWLQEHFQKKIRAHNEQGQELYKTLLDAGIAKESARFLLPMSSRTRLYMKGNIRSWIFYLLVRTHESTQKEHRDVANACKAIFIENFPVVAAAMEIA